MVDSEFIPPLTNLGDQGDLRGALIRRVPYTFTTTDNPEDYVAVDAGTGSIPWALVWAGRLFYFDPDDLTTAHDGITTIVTNDGYRYKVEGIAADQLAVLSRTVTAPPALPTIGDSYLVPSGSTGDWATHPNNIAIWTARGWRYIPPEIGQLVFVEDENGYYHYGTGGAWVSGIGSSALGTNTVRASSLIGGRTHWVVANQNTNTPPPTPSTGWTYIVGPAPTGAWAGQSGRIAVWEFNAWSFYLPQEGWTAYDQNLNSNFIYNGAWNQQASGYDSVQTAFTAGAVSPGLTGSTAYTYSHTTAPTTANQRYIDPQTLTIQAAYPGQRFEVDYSFAATVSNPTGVLAVFLDSETNAREWVYAVLNLAVSTPGQANVTFSFVVNDVSTHTLRIASLANTALSGWGRRRLIVRRLA